MTLDCPEAVGNGWIVKVPLGNLLDILAPNQLLKEKYREGWRACECKRRGMRAPKDLHRVGDAVAALRALARLAFLGVGPIHVCSLEFVLKTSRALDDDGWLFLPKPVIDGMTDAGCWVKDRRRINGMGGGVSRDSAGGVRGGELLLVRVVLP
jgi:hypothetical protein